MKLCPIKLKVNSPLKSAKLFQFVSHNLKGLLLAVTMVKVAPVYAMHDGQALTHPLILCFISSLMIHSGHNFMLA